jgi:hypothetical protein
LADDSTAEDSAEETVIDLTGAAGDDKSFSLAENPLVLIIVLALVFIVSYLVFIRLLSPVEPR